MASWEEIRSELLRGPLCTSGGPWPLLLCARLCDLCPRFLPKGEAGRGYRAVARNGRVLLASDRPVNELSGRAAHVRLQTWHRRILPGQAPEPWGIVLWVRCLEGLTVAPYTAKLERPGKGTFDVAAEVGGGMLLQFTSKVGEQQSSHTCTR